MVKPVPIPFRHDQTSRCQPSMARTPYADSLIKSKAMTQLPHVRGSGPRPGARGLRLKREKTPDTLEKVPSSEGRPVNATGNTGQLGVLLGTFMIPHLISAFVEERALA